MDIFPFLCLPNVNSLAQIEIFISCIMYWDNLSSLLFDILGVTRPAKGFFKDLEILYSKVKHGQKRRCEDIK